MELVISFVLLSWFVVYITGKYAKCLFESKYEEKKEPNTKLERD